jgi:hypothetical protein
MSGMSTRANSLNSIKKRFSGASSFSGVGLQGATSLIFPTRKAA